MKLLRLLLAVLMLWVLYPDPVFSAWATKKLKEGNIRFEYDTDEEAWIGVNGDVRATRLEDGDFEFYYDSVNGYVVCTKGIQATGAPELILPAGYRYVIGFNSDVSDSNAEYTATLTDAGIRILSPNIDVDASYFIDVYAGTYGAFYATAGNGTFNFKNPNSTTVNFGFLDTTGYLFGIRASSVTDQCTLFLDADVNNHFILTTYDNRTKDHNTSLETNPKWSTQSATDPTGNGGNDAYKRASMSHDGTNAIFEAEEGGVVLKAENNTVLLKLTAKSADPAEPATGYAVIWVSDGTGKGDDGDVMIGVNNNGTTKYGTLLDYSEVSSW